MIWIKRLVEYSLYLIGLLAILVCNYCLLIMDNFADAPKWQAVGIGVLASLGAIIDAMALCVLAMMICGYVGLMVNELWNWTRERP